MSDTSSNETVFLRNRIGAIEADAVFLRERIKDLEAENQRLRRSVTIAEYPRVLGARLEGLNTLWIGPCHIEGFSVFSERVGCTAQHLLYSSFPFENVSPFDATPFDCIVVGLTLRNLLLSTGGGHAPDFQHLQHDWSAENIDKFFDNCYLEMLRQVNGIHGMSAGRPIFFVPFLEPSFNFLGNIIKYGGLRDIAAFVSRLNISMEQHIRNLNSAYFLDINEMANSVGRMHLQDDVISFYTHAVFIGDFDVDLDLQVGRIVPPVKPTDVFDQSNRWAMLNEVLWSRLLDNMKIIRQIDSVKLIIVDLDDTMWRGIAAEPLPDGVENEEYFRTIGWPMAFAEALLYFKMRGGLIAICSKNDHDSTVNRFARLWGNRIRIDDFCSVKINWERKSDNIRSILAEVNILPESAVFIDDNPREVEEVKREFPGIRTLGFQHYDWRRIILQAPEMQVATLSEESLKRTELIKAKVARDLDSESVSRDEWLKSLEITVHFSVIRTDEHPGFKRSIELINKTNQFNTTGKRWASEEMATFVSGGGCIVAMTAKDRYTDNGIVGVALVSGNIIEQIVLSCRVFGLDIEVALLHFIEERFRKDNIGIIAKECATERNLASRDYFVRNGFVRDDEGVCALRGDGINLPEWISIGVE